MEDTGKYFLKQEIIEKNSDCQPVARFSACPIVPLSRDNERASVPLSRKVTLSHLVGNAITN